MVARAFFTRIARGVLAPVMVAAVAALAPTTLPAGSSYLHTAGGIFKVKVQSYKERRFQGVLQQQYDFSCGSAALASLLTYHYENPVAEEEIFSAMWEKGDQEKIKREGFSLLDMKNYLAGNGYAADGYRLELEKLRAIGVPAIALVTINGYAHFVVIKGIREDQILIGDPSAGTRSMSHPAFQDIWNGVVFLIRSHADKGKASFQRDGNWFKDPHAPLAVAVDRGAVGGFLSALPPILQR